MWLLLYLLEEGKQASAPFLPQDGSSDPRDAPPHPRPLLMSHSGQFDLSIRRISVSPEP